jgi:hypothetical protein
MGILEELGKALGQNSQGMPANRMGTFPPPGGQRPAQMMSPQALPSVDRLGLNIDALFGVGDKRVLAEMPLGPGRVINAAARFKAPQTAKVSNMLGEMQESMMGRGGAEYTLSKAARDALKQEDKLGFDRVQDAAKSILTDPDWRRSFDVQSDLTASVIAKWRQEQMTINPALKQFEGKRVL